ncbi:MFS transporter [Niallia sp. 03133]|uniref:MFS transporter n=1 Tax=Niallia sp. 03133 TaxID=3458060 RepID=UPI0040446746
MRHHVFVFPRLSVMMFIQYFITASWIVTMGLVLSKHGLSSIIGTAYSVGGVATIFSPIFIGMLADRFFPSEKLMGILHLISGVVLMMIPSQIHAGNETMFLLLLSMHCLLYQPTASIANNIAFNSIGNNGDEFPFIRVFGTISFIAAGMLIGQLGLSNSTVIFKISAVASITLGIYSFTLPHTPAPAKGRSFSFRDLLFLDAFALLKDKNYLVFLIGTTLMFIVGTFYNSFASVFLNKGFQNVASVMTIGQMSEVLFMVLMPFFFIRLGIKYMLLFGMIAWILRCLLFGLGAPDMVAAFMITAIALHGICYDFFFVTGEIYTNQKVETNIKAQAQSLVRTFTWGLGMVIGSFVSGNVFNTTITAQGAESLSQWKVFWMYPAGFAAVVAVFFFLLFKEEKVK